MFVKQVTAPPEKTAAPNEPKDIDLTSDEANIDGRRPTCILSSSWTIPQSAFVFVTSLAAALLFLLLGPYSNFGSAGHLDPRLYTGYFTRFSYLIHHYGITYYVSRLAWIVPGLLVFQVVTPAGRDRDSECALIMASSATALYFIVGWHYGRLRVVLALR